MMESRFVCRVFSSSIRSLDAVARCPGATYRRCLRGSCDVVGGSLCPKMPRSRCGTRMTMEEKFRLNFWEKFVLFGRIPWRMVLHAAIVVVATAWIVADNYATSSGNTAAKRGWHAALLPTECSTFGAGDLRDWPQDQLWLSSHAQVRCAVEASVRGYFSLPSTALVPVTVARIPDASDATQCTNGLALPTVVVETWSLEGDAQSSGAPLRALQSPPYARTTYIAQNASFKMPTQYDNRLLRGVWVFMEAEVANLQEERVAEHGCVRWSFALVANVDRASIAHVRLRSQGNSCSGLRSGSSGPDGVCAGDSTDGAAWRTSFWQQKGIPLAQLLLCVAYQAIVMHGTFKVVLLVASLRARSELARGSPTDQRSEATSSSGGSSSSELRGGVGGRHSLGIAESSVRANSIASDTSTTSRDGGEEEEEEKGDGDNDVAGWQRVGACDALEVIAQPGFAAVTVANGLLIYSAFALLCMKHPASLHYSDSEKGTGAGVGYPTWPRPAGGAFGLDITQSFGTFIMCAAMVAFVASSSRFNALFETVTSAAPQVLKMTLGVVPFFVGSTIIATGLMGECAERFSSIGNSAITLFAVMNGDVMRESFLAANTGVCASYFWASHLFFYTFLLFYMYVVMFVFVLIVESAFFDSEENKKKRERIKEKLTAATRAVAAAAASSSLEARAEAAAALAEAEAEAEQDTAPVSSYAEYKLYRYLREAEGEHTHEGTSRSTSISHTHAHTHTK